MKLFFICAAGKNRSKRAAELFSSEHDTDYLGIAHLSLYWHGHDMPNREREHLEMKIATSDYIFVMEQWMKDKLESLMDHPIANAFVLGIEDIYSHDLDTTALDKVLIEKVMPFLNECARKTTFKVEIWSMSITTYEIDARNHFDARRSLQDKQAIDDLMRNGKLVGQKSDDKLGTITP